MIRKHSAHTLPHTMTAVALVTVMLVALLLPTGCSLLSRDSSTTDEGAVSGTTGAPAVGPSPGEYGGTAPDKAADASAYDVASQEALTATPGDTPPVGQSAQEQMLVRSASMRVQVEKVDAAVNKLRDATTRYGGLIEQLQVSTDEGVPVYRPYAEGEATSDATPLAAYATVRVPQERFDAFVKEISGFGRVLSQSEAASDVTQQHIDLSARLKTLQAEEVRLREFLDAAKNVTEMLAVESELARVRSEIESLQGQIEYLERQVALSALTVEFTQPAPVVRPSGTDWGFADAITRGIRGAAAVLTTIITIVLSMLPVLVPLAIVVAIWLLVRRSRRAKTVAPTPADAEETTESE